MDTFEVLQIILYLVVLLALRVLCAGMTAPGILICAITATLCVAVTLLFVVPGGRRITADLREVSRTIRAGR